MYLKVEKVPYEHVKRLQGVEIRRYPEMIARLMDDVENYVVPHQYSLFNKK